jgi:hypothetical protein
MNGLLNRQAELLSRKEAPTNKGRRKANQNAIEKAVARGAPGVWTDESFLLCDEQVLSKRPLLVDPLRFAAKAGIAGHAKNLLR